MTQPQEIQIEYLKYHAARLVYGDLSEHDRAVHTEEFAKLASPELILVLLGESQWT